MAECKFCGQGAGFMRSEHPDCRKSYETGKAKILEMTRKALFNTGDFYKLTKNVEYVSEYSYIDTMEVQELLIRGWERAADNLISNGKLSKTTEERLLAFPEYFSFPALKNKHHSTLKRIHQAKVKREKAEIRKKREKGEMRVIFLIRRQGSAPITDNSLIREINEVADRYELSPIVLGNALVKGWKESLKDALNKVTMGHNEHERLVQLAVELTIPQSIVDKSYELQALRKNFIEREQTLLRARRRSGKERVIYLIRRQGTAPILDHSLIRKINYAAEMYNLDRKLLGEAILDGWEDAITNAWLNGNVGHNAYNSLVQLALELSIPQSIIIDSHELQDLRKLQVLCDLDRGMPPPGFYFAPGELPFNLIKSETLIWLDENAVLKEWAEVYPAVLDGWGKLYDAKYKWVGVGKGVVGVTNFHIYFAVSGARIRLSYDDIVAFDLTTEGILITQDNAKSTQLLLNTPDIDFTYKLLTRMAHL